jgi:hypothetical protein
MRNAYIVGLVAAAVFAAVVAAAEVSRPQGSCTAATNATAQTGTTLDERGILHKLEVTVSGTAKTCTVWVADSDGSLLTSNSFVSGNTLVSFTNNPVPVVGLVVTTAGANTNGITVTVKPTLER